MPSIRRLRPRAAAATVVAVAATAAVAAPAARATTVQVDAGTTTLVLDRQTADALSAQGISMSAVGAAEKGRGQLTLPITGGRIDPASGAGTLDQAGGLQFRAGGARVRMTAWSVEIGGSRTITVAVGARRVAAFSVSRHGAKVERRGFDTSLLGAHVALTVRGAAALNRALHVRAFRRGAPFATATFRSQPAEIALGGGATALAPDPGTAATLQAQGISLSPTPPAAAGPDGSIAFPIARGRMNARTLAGTVTQSGGLTFANSVAALTFSEPVVQTSGVAKLSARVGDRRMDVLRLDVDRAKDTVSGRTLTLRGIVATLTPEAAAALDQTFATSAFTAGMTLGGVTITALVR